MPGADGRRCPRRSRRSSALLIEALLALRRENKEVLYASMIKDTMKRKKPSFNESTTATGRFSDLLEDAAANGLVDIERHKERDLRGHPVRVRAAVGGRRPRRPGRPASPARPRPRPRPPPPGRRATAAPRPSAGRPPTGPPRPGPQAGPGPRRRPVAVPDAGDELVDLIEDRYGEE